MCTTGSICSHVRCAYCTESPSLRTRSINYPNARPLDISRLPKDQRAEVASELKDTVVDWRVVSALELDILDKLFIDLPKHLIENRSRENTFMVIRLCVPKRSRPELIGIRLAFKPIGRDGPVHRVHMFPEMNDGITYEILQLHGEAATHGVGMMLQESEWEFWVEKVTFAGA